MILVWLYWVKYITTMNFLCLFLHFIFNVDTRTFKITDAALLIFPWTDGPKGLGGVSFFFSWQTLWPAELCPFLEPGHPGTRHWWGQPGAGLGLTCVEFTVTGRFSLEFSPGCLRFLPSSAHPLLHSLRYSDSSIPLSPFSTNSDASPGLLCFMCKRRGSP